jgi:hypothetical protein
MPGELGNVYEQQGVGHYERRYVQTGEPNDPPIDASIDPKDKPKSKMILSVLDKFVKDE